MGKNVLKSDEIIVPLLAYVWRTALLILQCIVEQSRGSMLLCECFSSAGSGRAKFKTVLDEEPPAGLNCGTGPPYQK